MCSSGRNRWRSLRFDAQLHEARHERIEGARRGPAEDAALICEQLVQHLFHRARLQLEQWSVKSLAAQLMPSLGVDSLGDRVGARGDGVLHEEIGVVVSSTTPASALCALEDGKDCTDAPPLDKLKREDLLEEHVVATIRRELAKGGERRPGEHGHEDRRVEQPVDEPVLPLLAVLEALLVPPMAVLLGAVTPLVLGQELSPGVLTSSRRQGLTS